MVAEAVHSSVHGPGAPWWQQRLRTAPSTNQRHRAGCKNPAQLGAWSQGPAAAAGLCPALCPPPGAISHLHLAGCLQVEDAVESLLGGVTQRQHPVVAQHQDLQHQAQGASAEQQGSGKGSPKKTKQATNPPCRWGRGTSAARPGRPRPPPPHGSRSRRCPPGAGRHGRWAARRSAWPTPGGTAGMARHSTAQNGMEKHGTVPPDPPLTAAVAGVCRRTMQRVSGRAA